MTMMRHRSSKGRFSCEILEIPHFAIDVMSFISNPLQERLEHATVQVKKFVTSGFRFELASFSYISFSEGGRSITGFGDGVPGAVLWFRPVHKSDKMPTAVGESSTHVEYGVYAARPPVLLIMGFSGSQGLSPLCIILSSGGGLSTM